MEPGSVVQSKAESQEYVAVGRRGELNYWFDDHLYWCTSLFTDHCVIWPFKAATVPQST
jgi:hypothetical protein